MDISLTKILNEVVSDMTSKGLLQENEMMDGINQHIIQPVVTTAQEVGGKIADVASDAGGAVAGKAQELYNAGVKAGAEAAQAVGDSVQPMVDKTVEAAGKVREGDLSGALRTGGEAANAAPMWLKVGVPGALAAGAGALALRKHLRKTRG